MKKTITRKPRRVMKPQSVQDYFVETSTKPDYKEVLVLRKFITDRGKIIHQNFSNLTAKNQRLLSQAIKRARFMSLLPYTDKHAL